MKPKPMTDDEINAIVASAIDGAISFIEAEIQPQRIKAQRYFDGKVDIGHEEGRSKVVATKCRDVVRAIKPSLMRVFLSHDRPVEFIPRTPQDVAAAEQATDYIQWKFNEANGFRLLNDVFHDAMVKKVGILKAYYEEYSEVDVNEYTGLTDEQFALIVQDPEIEVVEHSAAPEMGPDGVVFLHDAKVQRASTKGEICIKSVPPEEFFIDPEARSLDDFYICGHQREMRVGDLVDMGFDFDEVIELAGRDAQDEEDFGRRGWDDEADQKADPSMQPIRVTEAYMRMDADGNGAPRLYSFICAGAANKVLSREMCDEVPFAIFEVDPEPHTFFGRSIVDLVMNDQDAATMMLRGVLDNVALTNNPRMIVNDSQVNMDDLLNNEIGGIVRTKDINAVQPLAVPFIAATTLPALQYMDELTENKTGVSRASMGLDPDALQNTTATAVQATTMAAAGQVEVIARNLAEGGMRQLFRLMLRLVHKHVTPGEFMRLNGKFVPVDPRSWNVHMHLIANVGLGTGKHEMRAATLREALALQQQIWGQYGPTNGLVSMTQMRNTFADILAMSGIHNADRYVNPMDPEIEQQLLMQAAQAAQEQQGQATDPAQALMQAETMKAQTRAQVDMAKAEQDFQKFMIQHQWDQQKAAADDDRDRDKMTQDLLIKAAEIIGKYGTAVQVEQIKQMQAQPRQFGGMI
jgi:hypothetical protein